MKVSGQLGTTTGKRLMLPGFFFSTGPHPQFVAEEKRTSAVDLHYAEQVIDDAVYPSACRLHRGERPTAGAIALGGPRSNGGQNHPRRGKHRDQARFARAFVLLDPKEYPALRDYYQKLAATDQQQLVLVKAVGATGN